MYLSPSTNPRHISCGIIEKLSNFTHSFYSTYNYRWGYLYPSCHNLSWNRLTKELQVRGYVVKIGVAEWQDTERRRERTAPFPKKYRRKDWNKTWRSYKWTCDHWCWICLMMSRWIKISVSSPKRCSYMVIILVARAVFGRVKSIYRWATSVLFAVFELDLNNDFRVQTVEDEKS